MTEQTNTAGTEAAAPKAPKVVKHIDVRIEEATAAVDAARAKLAQLINERDNRSRIESIDKGSVVTFEYGRGEKRRTLTGTVTATKDDDKQGRLLAVTVGEGFDAELLQIRAADVQFNAEGDALEGIS